MKITTIDKSKFENKENVFINAIWSEASKEEIKEVMNKIKKYKQF